MTKREIAERETRNDLAKSIDTLLTDVQDESLDLTRAGTETVSRTMARFASILVVLSRQAKEESDRNLQMQRDVVTLTNRLYILTIVLAVMTFIMLVQQFFK